MAGFFQPYSKYTVTKVSDGEGGFKETLSNQTTIYVNVQLYENEVKGIMKEKTEVAVEDIVLLKDGFYRIKKIKYMPPVGIKEVVFDRIEKPIYPN